MTVLRRLASALRALVHRRRDDAELGDELRAYLDAAIDAKVAAGMSRADAERAARVELGSTTAIRDGVRDVAWTSRAEGIWRDIRAAVRSLRRAPGFSLAAIATLALGIGVNVGMFTLFDGVLLKPLDLPAPDELVALHEHSAEGTPDTVGGTGRFLRFSYPRYLRLQQALGSHGSLAAMSAPFDVLARLDRAADGQSLTAQLVTGNLFSTLGVLPVNGRLLTPDDDRGDAAPVSVIGAGLWHRAFGDAPDIVGRSLRINEVVTTIVGVAPAGFVGGWADERPDVWLPVRLQPAVGFRNESSSYTPVDLTQSWLPQEIFWLRAVGRIPERERRTGETLLQAANHAALLDLAASADTRDTTMPTRVLVVDSFARGFSALRAQFSGLLLTLMLLVGLLLLLACANIASLLLVRAGHRGREVAIRAALGASAWRIAVQCLTENLLLAACGGATGYLIGGSIRTTLAVRIMGTARTIPSGLTSDGRVTVFAMAASFGTALLFGLAPTLHAVRLGRAASATLGQRTTSGSARPRGLRALVVGQFSLSVVVVFAAALLGRTLINLSRVDPGFAPAHLVGAYFNASAAGYSNADVPAVRERLIDAASSVPGVASAAVSSCGLLSNCSYSTEVRIEGSDREPSVQVNWVGPRYFSTIGRPLLRGREFDRHDVPGPPVAIISESLATSAFGGQDPIGRRLGFGQADTVVVGIARDARSHRLREAPAPMVFLLVDQPPPPRFRFAAGTIEARVDGDPNLAIPALRDAFHAAEPRLAVRFESISSRVAQQFDRERAVASLTFAFAGLALVLAAVGLYGVLAYGVGCRTREIGIRLALGAERGGVRRLILREAAWMTSIGLAAGLVAAPWLVGYLQTIFYEVSAFDPISFVSVAACLALVALAASYIPARRATRVDPVIALRAE